MALAVKQGLIEKGQVQECMDLQAALFEQKGADLPLVEIALRKKYLTPEQASNLSGHDGSTDEDHVTIETASRIHTFEVHEVIGQGGMATVFLATGKKSNRSCALKVLFPRHTDNTKFVERFIREGRLLKQFECENIAKGFDYGVAGKDSDCPLYFMSMEYIDGPSVQDLLDRDGPFDEQKAIYVIVEAAKALTYMQERGVVHRDVKPDNIMWASDGMVKLVDLGFATPISTDRVGEYEDETCGTVQYISPEQARGMADLDIRADIYSLGATLYHMVIGELPFTGKDSMEVMAKQVMENLDAQQLKGGKISHHMHYFIEKMMSKDRDFRYQTAREVVEDITEVLEGAADLQYDPAQDENSPFQFSIGSQASRVGQSTGKHTPVPGQSKRMRPDGQSVRMPGTSQRKTGKTSSGTRKPVPNKDTSSLRKKTIKPASSVRLPNSSKSVKLPRTKSSDENQRS